VIVLVVQQIRVAISEFKRDPPIAAHGNCPLALPLSFERMKVKSWYGHIFNCHGSFKCSQFKANLPCVSRLDPCGTPGLKKTAQSFVPKRLDHVPNIPCCALRNNRYYCCITLAATGVPAPAPEDVRRWRRVRVGGAVGQHSALNSCAWEQRWTLPPIPSMTGFPHIDGHPKQQARRGQGGWGHSEYSPGRMRLILYGAAIMRNFTQNAPGA